MKDKKIFLELGCGSRKKNGYIGLDRYYFDGVDVVTDIDKGLPFKDNSVDGIYSNYFMEHTTNLVHMFQEIYRVCKAGAVVTMTVPYYTSINAFKDPTHKQFFTEETFKYFSKNKWYGSDYKINTDFKVLNIEYHDSRLVKVLPFFKKYIRRFVINAVGAITVRLEVIK